MTQILSPAILSVQSRDGISDNRYIGKADIGFFVNIGYRYRLKSYRLKYRISDIAKISDIGWRGGTDIYRISVVPKYRISDISYKQPICHP